MKTTHYYILLIITLCLAGFDICSAADITYYPKFRADDSNGQPMSFGYVYSYVPGTTTPKATYTDASGDTANTNPVVLDNKGEADIYIDGDTKLVLKKKVGSVYVTQWSETVSGSDLLRGNTKYPDYLASDHGADDATYLTIKEIVDAAAAASDQETAVFLRNNSGGVTTAYTFLNDFDIPENITLEFENGAIISGVTPTINGIINAEPGQYIFDCPVLGAPNVDKVYASWFGMSETATSSTNETAIERAIQLASFDQSGPNFVQMLAGSYNVDRIDINTNSNRGFILAGNGAGQSSGSDAAGTVLISQATGDYSIYWDSTLYGELRDFVVDGNNTAKSIFVDTSNAKMTNFHSRDHTEYSLDNNALNVKMDNCLFIAGASSGATAAIHLAYNGVTLRDSYINGSAAAWGVLIDNTNTAAATNSVSIVDCTLEQGLGSDIKIEGDTSGVRLQNNYFESTSITEGAVWVENGTHYGLNLIDNYFATGNPTSIYLDELDEDSSIRIVGNDTTRHAKIDLVGHVSGTTYQPIEFHQFPEILVEANNTEGRSDTWITLNDSYNLEYLRVYKTVNTVDSSFDDYRTIEMGTIVVEYDESAGAGVTNLLTFVLPHGTTANATGAYFEADVRYKRAISDNARDARFLRQASVIWDDGISTGRDSVSYAALGDPSGATVAWNNSFADEEVYLEGTSSLTNKGTWFFDLLIREFW